MDRDRTIAMRHGLLHLHKVLAAAERVRIERMHGRLSGADYLQRLISDPTLQWLLVLSGLIVRLDELLEEDGAADGDTDYRDEVRQLLAPDPDGNEFQQRYAALLQESPEVVLAHRAAMQALR